MKGSRLIAGCFRFIFGSHYAESTRSKFGDSAYSRINTVFTKKNTTPYTTVQCKSRHNKSIFLAMTKIIMIIIRDLLKVLAQTNLQHNFLHFFIRTLKLTNQDQHHFSGVVVGILCIHKRDQVPNGFEKSSKTLKKKAVC